MESNTEKENIFLKRMKNVEQLTDEIFNNVFKSIDKTTKNISIVGHTYPLPDGDVICSSMGLAKIINTYIEAKNIDPNKNIDIKIIFACDTTLYMEKVFKYLSLVNEKTKIDIDDRISIECGSNNENIETIIKSSSIIFILDTDYSRTGIDIDILKNCSKEIRENNFKLINIDHHLEKENDILLPVKFKDIQSEFTSAKLIYSIDHSYSSTSERILDIFTKILVDHNYLKTSENFDINKYFSIINNIYQTLLGGIFTDSGRFYYTKYTSALFTISKFLQSDQLYLKLLNIDYTDLEPNQVMIDLLFDEKKDPTEANMKLMSFVYQVTKIIEIDNDKKIAVLIVDKKYLPIPASNYSIKPIHLLQNLNVDGCMQLTIDHEKKSIKGELRSSLSKYEVVNMAKKIPGGGGHKQAAGFLLDFSYLNSSDSNYDEEINSIVDKLINDFKTIFNIN